MGKTAVKRIPTIKKIMMIGVMRTMMIPAITKISTM